MFMDPLGTVLFFFVWGFEWQNEQKWSRNGHRMCAQIPSGVPNDKDNWDGPLGPGRW